MPVDHYENFPVASFLLPAHLRKPIEVIYRFARTADDFADEGDHTDVERLTWLDSYRVQLDRIERGGSVEDPLFSQLSQIIRDHGLPIGLFRDLLDAFSQDVVQKRYANIRELMDYCSRSANPIGRLLVHLNDRASDDALACSDAICSALQLINFWQDVAQDWAKGRVYLPQDEMARFGVSEEDIAVANHGQRWQALMAYQCDRARQLLNSGRPLTRILPGRMGVELRLVLAGGNAILDKIAAVRGDVFNHRPVLTKWDWLTLGPAAVFS